MILRGAAAWTVWIWGTRIWNIIGDDERDFAFKAVHVVLALVSVAFAVAVWGVANRGRRGREGVEPQARAASRRR